MTQLPHARERADLVEAGRSLFDRGLTHGSTGNLSIRIGDEVVVTPTGSNLGRLAPEDLSTIDLAGRHIAGPAPSKEAFLHATMLRARPSATAVVHTHSTHSAAVSCLAGLDPHDVLPPLTAYFAMRIGRLVLLDYFAPGDKGLEPAAERAAADHAALLLRNHGPIVAGATLASAVDALEELEQTAKLFLLLRGMDTRPLSPEERDAITPKPTTQGRTP
jgi:ribulose-5-phosphate 4-epimerase/fuculose-1-phosphate aldolase